MGAHKPQVSTRSTPEIINSEGTTYEPVSMEVDEINMTNTTR